MGIFGGGENFIPTDSWSFKGAILAFILCIILYTPIHLNKRLSTYPNKLRSNSVRGLAFIIVWYGSWNMVVFTIPYLFADFSIEEEVIETKVTQKVSSRAKFFQCYKRIDTEASRSFVHGELCVSYNLWNKIEEGQNIHLVGNRSDYGFLVTKFNIRR